MHYFVSTTYEPHYQWQIELLIESFKKHNMQDKLVVSFTKLDDEVLHPDFSANIISHPNIITHDNIGKTRGYSKLNDFYALYWALKAGHLEQPFMVIPTDSVMFSPPSVLTPDYPYLQYQVDPFFTPELVINNVGNIIDIDLKNENWPSMGSILCFTKFPIEFFEQGIELVESLVYKQLKENGKIWEYTERLAWNLMVFNRIGDVSILGVYDYESDMMSNFPKNFIHYDRGFLPIFHKDMFPYLSPNYFSFGNPFKVLGENSPTGAFKYMSDLANVYNRRKQRLQKI